MDKKITQIIQKYRKVSLENSNFLTKNVIETKIKIAIVVPFAISITSATFEEILLGRYRPKVLNTTYQSGSIKTRRVRYVRNGGMPLYTGTIGK
jgi:hypothetical protein